MLASSPGQLVDVFPAAIDRLVAQFVLKNFPQATEETACFIAYLSLASRLGHLCVEVNNEILNPALDNLWQTDTPATTDLAYLNDCILKGAKEAPPQLFSYSGPINKEADRFYLQKNWHLETLLLESFQRLIQTDATIKVDIEAAQQSLNLSSLLPEQNQAVLQACMHSFSIICGGPGTGKTYTAGHLVKTLWHSLTEEQRNKFKITLTAPTGKAAANLQKSFERVINSLHGCPPVNACTLHHLLGIHGKTPYRKILSADLIIVDESSMIDIGVMHTLLSSIKPGARLVFLGDPFQLPPVESGGVFTDFVDYLAKTETPAIQLQACMRTEQAHLLSLAESVKQGASKGIPSEIFIELDAHDLIAKAAHFFSKNVDISNPRALFEAFNQFRILSPLRKGIFGCDYLNERIKNQVIENLKGKPALAFPIMLIKNDPKLQLFNGEVGILIDDGSSKYALFQHNSNELRCVSAIMLPPYEYAYCLSVHKSQGSEFENVLLALPEGSENFGKEVLYTAITRAKKQLEIWTTKEVFNQTLQRHTKRVSGIVARLELAQTHKHISNRT